VSTPDEQHPVQVRVTSGGVPGPEQLAALVLALTPVVGPGPGPDDEDTEDAVAHVPAWTRAALLEGIGGRNAVSAPDLAGLA